MAFGSALRSSGLEYINSSDIEILRRDVNIILNELFSRDADTRLGGLRSFSGLGSLSALGEREALEVYRRYNLAASLANNRVKSTMVFAEIHPKYDDYGEFPKDFQKGKRVEDFLAMDVSTIDCIIQQYSLPRDRRPDYLHSNSLLRGDRFGGSLLGRDTLRDRLDDRYGLNSLGKQHKLFILFEWLGVDLSNERLDTISDRLGPDSGVGRIGGGRLLSPLGSGRVLGR